MRFIFQTAPLLGLTALAALSTVAARPAAAQAYTFNTIDYPGAFDTFLLGISNNGELAGFYETFTPGQSLTSHGFTEAGGIFTTVDDPFGKESSLSGVNNSGEVVGAYADSSLINHSFTEVGGVFTPVADPLASDGTEARGINNAGEVVGSYIGLNGVGQGGEFGFTEIGGTYTPLADLLANNGTLAYGVNNSGEVVGDYFTGNTEYAFTETGGVYTTLGQYTAYGINDDGEVSGAFVGADHNVHDFTKVGNNYTTFDVPLSAYNEGALGVNESGVVVGYYQKNDLVVHGFVGTPTSTSPGGPVGGGSVAPEPSSVATVGIVALFVGGLMLKARKRHTAV